MKICDLTLEGVMFDDGAGGVCGPLSYRFEPTGIYCADGPDSLLRSLRWLLGRQKNPLGGRILYAGEPLSRFSVLNRTYEELVFQSGAKYIDELSVIDNWTAELYPLYRSHDVALDAIASALENFRPTLDYDRKFGRLTDVERSIVELFSTCFFEYRLALVDNPIGDKPLGEVRDYLDLLGELGRRLLIIVCGNCRVFDEAEHLEDFKAGALSLTHLGELYDEE